VLNLFFMVLLIIVAFQNCGKVAFSTDPVLSSGAGLGGPGATPPSSSSLTYAWTGIGYGSCSTTCGTGTQSPNYECLRSDGVTVNDSFCSSMPMPLPVISCTNTTTCSSTPTTTTLPPGVSPYTYSWLNLGYSSCSTTCGTGTRMPSYSCLRNDGLTVDNSLCSSMAVPGPAVSCTDTSSCVVPPTTTMPPTVTTLPSTPTTLPVCSPTSAVTGTCADGVTPITTTYYCDGSIGNNSAQCPVPLPVVAGQCGAGAYSIGALPGKLFIPAGYNGVSGTTPPLGLCNSGVATTPQLFYMVRKPAWQWTCRGANSGQDSPICYGFHFIQM
jgi:hypothetical protein